MLFTNRDILSHLRGLNVLAELVLEVYDLSFKQAHLFHKVLEELVLMHFAALLCKQLHFFFGHGKNQHLLILVKDAVSTHVEHFNEFLRCCKSQKVVDMVTSLVVD